MSIYEELRQERNRQDAKWGGSEHDDQHTAQEWLMYMHRQDPFRAKHRFDARFRKTMIRTAALAIAAIEAMDRRKEPRP